MTYQWITRLLFLGTLLPQKLLLIVLLPLDGALFPLTTSVVFRTATQ